MAKFVKISSKVLDALIKKAKDKGALALIKDIRQNLDGGPFADRPRSKGFSSKAKEAARAEGKHLLPKSDFQKLVRAAEYEGSLNPVHYSSPRITQVIRSYKAHRRNNGSSF